MNNMWRTILYILSLYAVAVIVLYNHTRGENREWATISSKSEELLLTGDVIFTQGVSFKSDVVRAFGGDKTSGLSHCGIIVRDSTTSVVHMSIDKDMITREPIAEFMQSNQVAGFTVCRVVGGVVDSKLLVELEGLLNSEIAFDNGYNATDDKELYCTELVCSIYERLYQINLYPRENRREIIYPYEIFINNNLKPIKL